MSILESNSPMHYTYVIVFSIFIRSSAMRDLAAPTEVSPPPATEQKQHHG